MCLVMRCLNLILIELILIKNKLNINDCKCDSYQYSSYCLVLDHMTFTPVNSDIFVKKEIFM